MIRCNNSDVMALIGKFNGEIIDKLSCRTGTWQVINNKK
jgi:hypothetical protein